MATKSRIKKLVEMTEQLGETMHGGYYVDDMWQTLRSEGFVLQSHFAPPDVEAWFFANKEDDLKAMEHIYLVSALKKADADYHL